MRWKFLKSIKIFTFWRKKFPLNISPFHLFTQTLRLRPLDTGPTLLTFWGWAGPPLLELVLICHWILFVGSGCCCCCCCSWACCCCCCCWSCCCCCCSWIGVTDCCWGLERWPDCMLTLPDIMPGLGLLSGELVSEETWKHWHAWVPRTSAAAGLLLVVSGSPAWCGSGLWATRSRSWGRQSRSRRGRGPGQARPAGGRQDRLVQGPRVASDATPVRVGGSETWAANRKGCDQTGVSCIMSASLQHQQNKSGTIKHVKTIQFTYVNFVFFT